MFQIKCIRVFAVLCAAPAFCAGGTVIDPSIGMSPSGTPRIVATTDYYQPIYCQQNPNWTGQFVANLVPSGFLTAAFAPWGDIYLVEKPFDGSLVYYYNPGGGTNWYRQNVAAAGATNDAPAIAVGPDGSAHIVARKSDGSLMHYYSPGGGIWHAEWFTRTTGYAVPRIAIGPTGHIHVIAVNSSGALDYFYSAGNGFWSSKNVDAGGVYMASIGVDSYDQVHIGATTWSSQMFYYKGDLGSFGKLLLGSNAGRIAIAVTPTADVHFAVTGAFNGTLRYLSMIGAAPVAEVNVAGPGSADFVGITVDALGRVYIASQTGYSALTAWFSANGTQWSPTLLFNP